MSVALLGMLVGCQSFTAPEDSGRELAEARARWTALGLQSYSVLQARQCECLPPHEYTLVVDDGRVAAVLYEPAPHWPEVSGTASFLAIEQVFDLLERVLERRPAFWRVEYHPREGYPTRIFIDIDAGVAGEEISLTMADLKPVSP